MFRGTKRLSLREPMDELFKKPEEVGLGSQQE